jgi:Rrf2 family protein
MGFLSKATVHGVRAAAFVALRHEPGKFVPIHEISAQLDISFHFLTKILQQLTASGILVSSRGPRGGVALARPAGQVSVLDIVESIQGALAFKSCILGLEGCGDAMPCPLHARWAVERTKIRSMFGATKLSEMAHQVRGRKLRLADGPLKFKMKEE